MKGMNDETIQELLEKGLSPSGTESSSDDKDIKAYQLLFEELGKKPAIDLPGNFSAKVTARLKDKKEHINDISLYLLVGMILLGLAGYFMLADFNTGFFSQFIISFHKYKSIFFTV